jgi:hypothetical protein
VADAAAWAIGPALPFQRISCQPARLPQRAPSVEQRARWLRIERVKTRRCCFAAKLPTDQKLEKVDIEVVFSARFWLAAAGNRRKTSSDSSLALSDFAILHHRAH